MSTLVRQPSRIIAAVGVLALALVSMLLLSAGEASAESTSQVDSCSVGPHNRASEVVLTVNGIPASANLMKIWRNGSVIDEIEPPTAGLVFSQAPGLAHYSVAIADNSPRRYCGSYTYQLDPTKVEFCSVSQSERPGEVTIFVSGIPASASMLQVWLNGGVDDTLDIFSHLRMGQSPGVSHYSISILGESGRRYCGSYNYQPNAVPVYICDVDKAGSQMAISWTKGNGDQNTGYSIRRNGEIIAENVTGTNWTDSSVVAGQRYHYSVLGEQGSTLSNPRYCGSQLATAQVALWCSTSGQQNGTAIVTWGGTTTEDGAAQVVVRRSRDNGSFWWVGRVSAPTGRFHDTSNLTAGSRYTYTVETIDADGTRSQPRDCGWTNI